MSSYDCSNHPGLIGAIGSCSDETKSILNKALSYLGISYTTPRRAFKGSPNLVLSLDSKTSKVEFDQIEFDDETRSWRCSEAGGAKSSEAAIPAPAPAPRILPATSDGDTTHDNESLSLSEEDDDDWTMLLPSTDHVKFLKSREWEKTSLGPMLQWPVSLKLMTMKMLGDPRPANLYWGPNRIAIYNEPFSIVAASRHPMMMASTAQEAMPVTYPFLAQVFDEIERTGVAFSMPEFEMQVEKVAGFVEEAWYDGMFSPIRDVDGTFVGLYNSGYEVTTHQMTQRNAEVIHQIVAGPGSSSSTLSSWQHIVEVCSKYDRDIPFLVLYSVDEQTPFRTGKLTVRYEGSLGIEMGHPSLPESLDIHQGNEGFMPILRAARAKESLVALDMPGGKLPDFLAEGVNWRGHGDPCTHIVASPLLVTGLVTGFLVIGVNPRRLYDDSHQQFVEDIIRASNGLLAYGIGVRQAQQRELKLTKELTQKQKFLQRIAEVATVGLYSYNNDGLLTWANSMFFEITGIDQKPEERYNFKCNSYIHDDDQEEGMRGFFRCLETESVCTLELRLKKTWRPPETDDRESCWILTTFAPNVENGETVGLIGCVTDISHLKWVEKVQTEMAEAAKLAKEQQERFIDFTSHEMRNPLGAILQCADDITMLAKNHAPSYNKEGGNLLGEPFQAILENAKSILFCANHQNRIVDDILTVSKLDSSMLTITPVVMDPRVMVNDILRAYANKLAADGINPHLEIQGGYVDLRITSIYADPSRITQILVNLITNAIKFTRDAPRRELVVRINALQQHQLLDSSSDKIQWFPSNAHRNKSGNTRVLETANDTVYIMFEVEDSGTGMSKDEMKGLFNRFTQASPKTHITYGGSGLGLFISRELVELQGGMIGVSSQLECGSVFAFYIEVRKVESAKSTEAGLQQTMWSDRVLSSMNEEAPISRLARDQVKRQISSDVGLPTRSKTSKSWSILFVEDNLINQKVLSKQLKRLGCLVHVANQGMEALEVIKKSKHWKDDQSSDLVFDVILMDWEMPVMDGITCTKKIRELEVSGDIMQHLPIVGATANARPEQVEVALSAGMDDLITKPFTVTTLMERIESLLAR